MKNIQYSELSEINKELLDSAEKAMELSYDPYSGFSVGAALLTFDNKIITGANIENASSSVSVCAERSAILNANNLGYKKYKCIAVIARGKDFKTKEVTSPCGSCRQVIYEFSQLYGEDIEIIMSTTAKDKIIISSISKLLPLAFGPKDLGVNIKKFQENPSK